MHALVSERPLIIGGVNIPYERGLLGHSDADVLLHAIMDAMLGALALGDLGKHFPDQDEKYRGISSKVLFKHVDELVKARTYRVVNLDCVVVAQKPKLAPYIQAMRDNIAQVLAVGIECVSVKATTTEHLGFEGREEGISAQAVVLLEKFREEEHGASS